MKINEVRSHSQPFSTPGGVDAVIARLAETNKLVGGGGVAYLLPGDDGYESTMDFKHRMEAYGLALRNGVDGLVAGGSQKATEHQIKGGRRAVTTTLPAESKGVVGVDGQSLADAVEVWINSVKASKENNGVVGGRPLLDTCNQVDRNTSENEICSWEGKQTRKTNKEILANALDSCGRPGEADKVRECGEVFKVGECADCGANPAFPLTCGHRLCADCAARRGAILVAEHEAVLHNLHNPKMLTLTWPSVEHLTKEVIKEARNDFRRLRKREVMASCWGGIYSFEATHNKQGWHYDARRNVRWYCKKDGWHLHAHILIGSGYIAQKALSREWESISGAKVVDIRAVKGDDKWAAVREVIKYPCKSETFIDNPNLVNEFLLATVRVNLAYGFGAMYRVKTKRHIECKMVCPVCGGENIDFSCMLTVPRADVRELNGGYVWLRAPPGFKSKQLAYQNDSKLS